MFNIYHDPNINKIIIETDDISVKCLLEFKRTVTDYNSWQKRWETKDVIEKIYTNKNTIQKHGQKYIRFILRCGWVTYLMSVFRNMMSQDDYNNLLNIVLSDYHREIPFPNLRDYQNEDMLFILKYKRAIIQTNTSFGKTECISTLINYAANELGDNVLVITPGKKAKDEIVKRYKLRFNGEMSNNLSDKVSCIITSGFLNRKDVKDPEKRKIIEEQLKTKKWVFLDEAEYIMNNAGIWILDHLVNSQHNYAFSGTADKISGKMISFANGIDDTVMNNKELVSFFGPALVYRMPLNIKVNYINLKTSAFDNIEFTENDFASENNVFLEIMSKIWTDHEVCNLIVKMVRRFPGLFIPVNDLNNIILNWINNYFVPNHFRVLLICFEGYIYYDEYGNTTNLDLTGACDYVKRGLVDVIPGTSSSFRALDLPSLKNILMISSVRAGATLQQIGRVARSDSMNIIELSSKSGKKIPIHTKNSKHRYDMIHEYYKYSEIIDIYMDENEL